MHITKIMLGSVCLIGSAGGSPAIAQSTAASGDKTTVGSGDKSKATPSEQSKFDNKSDFEKGQAQIKAQNEGKPYADPSRQKALDDAMHSDDVKTGTPKSSDSSKVAPR